MKSFPQPLRLWKVIKNRVPDGKPEQRAVVLINGALFLLAIIAALSLIAEYGFYLSSELREASAVSTVLVLYGFVILGIMKFLLAPEKKLYARKRWMDIALTGVIVLHLIIPTFVEKVLLGTNPLLAPESLTRAYLALAQFFSILAFVPTALRYSRKIMAGNIQPSLLILSSFALMIVVGTGLLLLPKATVDGSISLLDALFTATSAVCVTGLIVVDTGTFFTPLGHTIILALIQIGGLGIMTLTTFFAYVLGGGARLKEYATMQNLLGEENLGRIRRTIITIAVTTFLIEALGAFLLYEFNAVSDDKLFFSLFHSVSAFCNAGFTLTTENLAAPGIQDHAGFLTTIMMLIVFGGIGFPVLVNLWSVVAHRRRHPSPRLTLHTKIVLVTSGILILGGSVMIGLLESDNHLKGGMTALDIVFQSITARTAGFNTVTTADLTMPTIFILIILMWVGASPGSTGGGVKTTTAALAFLNIRAVASGRNRVEVFGKQVPTIAVVKAFSTALLSFGFIAVALLILTITERQPFEHLFFEVVSAISTVGLSLGVTPGLSATGKIVILLSMLFGRVGLLAVIIALTKRHEEGHYEFTHENVLVT